MVATDEAWDSSIYDHAGSMPEAQPPTALEAGPAPVSGRQQQPLPPSAVPEPPAGTGPLYKCAICQEFVYESQLDFHVLVCPDPDAPAEVGEPEDSARGMSATTEPTEGKFDTREEGRALSGTILEEDAPHAVLSLGSSLSVAASPEATQAQAPPAPALPHAPPAAAPVAQVPLAQRLAAEASAPAAAQPKPSKPQQQLARPRSQPAGTSRVAMQAASDSADADGPAKTPRKTWKQWKDSGLAQHIEEQTQRLTIRRSKITEELRAKEDEECTFHPRLNASRGSPRSWGKGADIGEAKWSQRWEQRLRSQRLKQVEAEHYADLTLKPKISRFAQAWSQRQTEVSGQSKMGVFDRLHSMAQAREAKVQAVAEASLREETSKQGSSVRGSVPRRIPTSELLYSDALDRRERLKMMAEQLQSQDAEVARAKLQVLGRSRRYYWQMLERQIKAAFDGTTNEGVILSHAELEEFLVRFGCARQRAEHEPEDQEGCALRDALWGHLDPNKSGHTDLLTLTVFFHVLMGAVDDAARASQGLPEELSTGGNRAEGVPSPCRSPRSHQALSPGSQSAAALAAISEEDAAATEGEDSADGHRHKTSSAPALHASPREDDEGRRIMNLLLRFDPVRLRAEFRPLYMHRMHYQHQQDEKRKKVEEKVEEEVAPPEVVPKSRALAKDWFERQKGSGDGVQAMTHGEFMQWQFRQTEAKKEEKRAQAAQAEVEGCTFRPKTSPRVRDDQVFVRGLTPTGLMQDVITPRGVTRGQVLYARAVEERERREHRQHEDKLAKSQNEVRDCTFRPDTAKSSQSYHRAHEAAPPMPRGFYESRQRLRAAGENTREINRKLTDRMGRLSPSTPGSAGKGPASSPGTRHSCGELSRDDSVSSPLPPVAEGSPYGQRSPRTTRSTGALGTARPRPRSANSTTGRGRASGPTVASPRQRTTSPGAAPLTPGRGPRPRSQPPGTGRSGPAIPASNRAAAAAAAAAAAMAALDASPRTPGNVKAAPSPTAGHEVAPLQRPRPAPEDKSPLPPPLLYVDVNIAPGQPPERIVLREGECVNEVAAEFAARHVLTPVLAQRLHALLKEVLQRQEQHLTQAR